MCHTGKHKNQDKINKNMRGRDHTDSSRVVATNGVPLGLHLCRRDTPVVPPSVTTGGHGSRSSEHHQVEDVHGLPWSNCNNDTLSSLNFDEGGARGMR